jgi:phage tail protein X
MARTYTVVAGDTLSAIALRFYGNANLFPLIATANGIADPNVILDGQVLTIPDPPGQTIPPPGQTIPDPPNHDQLQPFFRELSLGWSNHETFATTKTFFKVPAGKRLVLEDISIAAEMAKGQKLLVNLLVVGANAQERIHGMPVVFQMTGLFPEAPQTDHYAGGRPLRIYLEPGEILATKGERDSATGTGIVTIFVHGHFMDISP